MDVFALAFRWQHCVGIRFDFPASKWNRSPLPSAAT